MRHRRTGGSGTKPGAGSGEFDQFVEQSLRSLTRAAILITWNLADAEDVVQEALYRTARHWGRVREMANPYAYARRVVIHRALCDAEKRATRRLELYGLPEGVADERTHVGAVDLRLDLAKMLGQLPARQRTVVVLRFAEQMTEAEVADLLGWPLGTVKSTAARALERLRTDHRTFGHGPVKRAPDESRIPQGASSELIDPSASTARSGT